MGSDRQARLYVGWFHVLRQANFTANKFSWGLHFFRAFPPTCLPAQRPWISLNAPSLSKETWTEVYQPSSCA